MPGQVNPDGTVQVSPPLASAFGAASQSAPPPPMQAPQPGAAPPTADPGFAGAIMSLIHGLLQFAPKSLTQAKARTDQNIASQE